VEKCFIRQRMAEKQIKNMLELMRVSGVSRNAITKLYHGEGIETSKIGTLMRLCDALDCSLSDLIEYTPDEK
jgi:putative transcriptional regulator